MTDKTSQDDDDTFDLKRRLYCRDMKLSQFQWEQNNVRWVRDRLARYVPKPGEPDLRGFEWRYLNAQCNRDERTIQAHSRGVRQVAFSPDGKQLASVGDGCLQIWDVPTGEELFRASPMDDGNCVAFSPNGKWIVAGTSPPAAHGIIKRWNTQTGEEISSAQVDRRLRAEALVFHPDGNRVVVGDYAGFVAAWDIDSGNFTVLKERAEQPAMRVAISSDGTRIAAAFGNYHRPGRVVVWDLASGEELAVLVGHTEPIRAVAFTDDDYVIATASWDGTARLWDIESQEVISTLNSDGGFFSLAINPVTQDIALAGKDRFVKLWDGYSSSASHSFQGHDNLIMCVAISPDGGLIASASNDGTIKFWTTRAPETTIDFPGSFPTDMAISPDGRLLAVAGEDKNLRLWDLEFSELKASFRHTNRVERVAFSPDGRFVASSIATHKSVGRVQVFDVESTRLLHRWHGHTEPVKTVALSPEGNQIASAGWDETIHLWEATSGREINVLRANAGPVYSLAYRPDGCQLASAGSDGVIRLWNAKTATLIATLKGHTSSINKIVFHPDGRRLLSGSNDETIRIWDTNLAIELCSISQQSGSVTSLAIAPDGQSFACGTSDGSVQLWSLESGDLIRAWTEHAERVSDVVFSPTGNCLATASWDGTAKIWDIESQSLVWSVSDEYHQIVSIAFVAGGECIAVQTGSFDLEMENAYRRLLLGGDITIWSIADRTKKRTIYSLGHSVDGFVFMPGEQTVVLACGQLEDGGLIGLWNVETLKQEGELRTHTDRFNHFAFSPDSHLIATAAVDDQVTIWDVATKSELAAFHEHEACPRRVAFSSDGRLPTERQVSFGIWQLTNCSATPCSTQTMAGH